MMSLDSLGPRDQRLMDSLLIQIKLWRWADYSKCYATSRNFFHGKVGKTVHVGLAEWIVRPLRML